MSIDFNGYAASYARNRTVQPNVLRSLLAHGSLNRGDKVLEIGCGSANYLIAICDATGASGFGIDPAPAMLAQARANPPGSHLNLIGGLAESLPYRDHSFAFAYMVDVIHHVRDRVLAADSVFRVLEPGARYCIATDSAGDIGHRVPLSTHFPETIPHERRRYPPLELIAEELRGAGFEQVTFEPVTYEYDLTDITAYREKAFSSLRLITDDEFSAGISRLEADLERGPIAAQSIYTLIWAKRP